MFNPYSKACGYNFSIKSADILTVTIFQPIDVLIPFYSYFIIVKITKMILISSQVWWGFFYCLCTCIVVSFFTISSEMKVVSHVLSLLFKRIIHSFVSKLHFSTDVRVFFLNLKFTTDALIFTKYGS